MTVMFEFLFICYPNQILRFCLRLIIFISFLLVADSVLLLALDFVLVLVLLPLVAFRTFALCRLLAVRVFRTLSYCISYTTGLVCIVLDEIDIICVVKNVCHGLQVTSVWL